MAGRRTRAGVIVAFEGLDGSGKSTLADRLAGWLAAEGVEHDVLAMYGNPILARQLASLNAGEFIGAREAALMYAAELAGRVAFVAEPLRARGGTVVWDKYALGARVRDELRDIPPEFLDAAYANVPLPDLTVFVAVEPDVATARKQAGGRLTMWESGLDVFLDLPVAEIERRFAAGTLPRAEVVQCFREFQARVHDGYEKHLATVEHLRLDGTRPTQELAETVRYALRDLWSRTD